MTELHSSKHQFESPPVFETALTIQFRELQDFRSIHFGQFYSLISEDFRVAEDKPRVDPINETFPHPFRMPGIRLVEKKHGPERVWYRDKPDGARLVQLQPDRVSLNWRKTREAAHYPTFAENGSAFLDIYGKLRDFAQSQNLGEIEPDLAEVVYVNHIFPTKEETAIECFARIFSGVEWKSSNEFLKTPEVALLNRVYEIPKARGRLYSEAGIGKDPEQDEFVQLKMTARVLIEPDENIVSALQTAHDWVVNGFVSLTTSDARTNRWGEVPI